MSVVTTATLDDEDKKEEDVKGKCRDYEGIVAFLVRERENESMEAYVRGSREGFLCSRRSVSLRAWQRRRHGRRLAQ